MFSIWFNDVAVYHLINIISGIYYWYLKFEWNALPWKVEISQASCWQNNIIVLTFKKYYSWIKAKGWRKKSPGKLRRKNEKFYTYISNNQILT